MMVAQFNCGQIQRGGGRVVLAKYAFITTFFRPLRFERNEISAHTFNEIFSSRVLRTKSAA